MRSSEPPDAAGDGAAPLALALPEGPLSMTRLLALEPAALRQLLTMGLRAGLDGPELDACCAAAAIPLGQAPEELRARLQERGWLHWDADRQRWRTRLGAARPAAPPQG
jgi:hypothetical protein